MYKMTELNMIEVLKIIENEEKEDRYISNNTKLRNHSMKLTVRIYPAYKHRYLSR